MGSPLEKGENMLYYDVADKGMKTGNKEVRLMRRRTKKEGGFSLIEVLITIFILGVVCITLISVFIYGFNLLQKTKKVAVATEVAQEEVERYRNMQYSVIKALATGTSLDLSTEGQAILGNPVNFINGQGSATLDTVVGGDDNIRKLTVQITWIYRAQPQEKNVVTYIASSGINREE
jgi:prepilin-type N-terminal cleavage/methylation domain-containing protein